MLKRCILSPCRWPLPSPPTSIAALLTDIREALRLPPPVSHLALSLQGFELLHSSPTSLLKDGEQLRLDPVAWSRKQPSAPPALPAPSAPEAAPNAQNGESPGAFASTPPDKTLHPQVMASEKRPSRSARRKAAKRRYKRMGGAPALGPPKKPRTEKLEAAMAVVGGGSGRQPAVAVERGAQAKAASDVSTESDTSGSSSSSSESSSSSSDESSESAVTTSSEDASSQQGAHPNGHTSTHPTRSPHHQLQAQLTEEAFAALDPCPDLPAVGQAMAYKLLEIGADYAPRVSEIRMGQVTAVEPQARTLTLEPYPHASVHPLAHQRVAWPLAEVAYGEEEESREPPPTNYDDTGVLTADRASFVELRYVAAGDRLAHDHHKVAGATVLPEGADTGALDVVHGVAPLIEPLEPPKYSPLGPPPRPSAVASLAPSTWADLAAQLQRRRAELSTPTPPRAQQQEEPEEANHHTTNGPALEEAGKVPNGNSEPDPAGAASGGKQAKPSSSRGRGRGRGNGRRAMQSALGPMLRMLRSNSQL